MQANIHRIPGSHILHDFQIPPGVKMTGGPITLESKRCSNSLMTTVNKDYESNSAPPHPQGLLTSQVPSMSQESAQNPKRQKKSRVFTEDQNLVLQVHFHNCNTSSRRKAGHWVKDLASKSTISIYGLSSVSLCSFVLIR